MNKTETAMLLAVAASFDYRTVGDTDVIAWHGALHTQDFARCRDAVIYHYGKSDDRITPAQIRHLINPDAANKPVPVPPESVAQNPAEWRKRVSAARAQGPISNRQRRALVLAYPDIAKRLTEPPLRLADPAQWTGFVPAETREGKHGPIPNDSPVRAQLAAILQAAAERADAEAATERQAPAAEPVHAGQTAPPWRTR